MWKALALLAFVLLSGTQWTGAQKEATAGERPPDISLKLTAAANTTKVGSAVTIQIVETNITDHPVPLGPLTKGMIRVTDSEGNPVKKAPPVVIEHPAENGKPAWEERFLDMGSSRTIDLAPRESMEANFELNLIFDLSKPGKYTAQAVAFDPKTVKVVKVSESESIVTGTTVTSNAISLTITPAE